MTFISLEFLVFFCIVIPLYFLLPFRLRNPMLLLASYVFYGWGGAWYMLLLLLATGVNYFAAFVIDQSPIGSRRTLALVLCLFVTFGILFVYKYYNFFVGTLDGLLALANIPFDPAVSTLPLPIGISFFTFQAFSYTVDVYRRQLAVERNLPNFALFVVFFPQLVAGPIERAGNLLHQLKERHDFDADRTVEGLRLILWGFFKKVVIGDYAAGYVNAIYNSPQEHTGIPLILATFFFAFQIYCDFSAYSDIAIGIARILGIELMQNFRQPYLSKSVREFWTRWHISLSTWFRDYLYIPLGGNRVPVPRQLINLFVVFLVSGLWHGASWTFVIWGALHGLFVVVEAVMRRRRGESAPSNDSVMIAVLKIVGTFLLVNFAWIFFRANSFSDAGYIVSHLFQFGTESFSLEAAAAAGGWTASSLLLAFGLIALLLFADVLDARVGLVRLIGRMPVVLRWGVYYVATAGVFIALNSFSIVQQFIYFRF